MKCFLIPLALGLCLMLQAQKPQEPHKVQKAKTPSWVLRVGR